jgi:hypothetical protein
MKCGMFPDGCRDWRLFHEAYQTWDRFKTHLAQQDRNRTKLATAANSGFNGTAFHLQGPISSSSPPIVTDNVACAATILPTGAELLTLLVKLHNLRTTDKPSATPSPPINTSPRPASVARGYCWTHVSTANAAHSSAICQIKAPGTSTRPPGAINKMGTPTHMFPSPVAAPMPLSREHHRHESEGRLPSSQSQSQVIITT